MKNQKEAKIARSIIEISQFEESFKKKAYIISFLSLLLSVVLLFYLVLFSKIGSISSHLLSFFAGVWMVWAYTKYTEVLGLKIISGYLDVDKAKRMYTELGGDVDNIEPEKAPIVKIVFTIISWAIIGYIIVYALNNFKNV